MSRSSPSSFRAADVPSPRLAWATHETPLGEFQSGWTAQGLYRLRWAEAASAAEPTIAVVKTEAEPWKPEIAEFDRRLQAFCRAEPEALQSVRIDTAGWTPFFTQIYQVCRQIPWGETRRYADLAAATGRPREVRAVGQAMARNRMPLVIPCHRVVASDGSLRGFSAPGGLATKRRLLDLERQQS